MRNVSELRQDLVTGDWVTVATGRARRPNAYARERPAERPEPKSTCPFERLLPSALLVYDRAGLAVRLASLELRRSGPAGRPHRPTAANLAHLRSAWWLQVVPNKYPAFGRGQCRFLRKSGPYRAQDGVGFHEVVVTRDHTRTIAEMTPLEAAAVLASYRERYLALKDEACAAYVAVFHNHGREAGATLSHPHSQIIAIPVVPPDVGRSLAGARAYFRRHRRCVHCAMLSFELKSGRRIVYRNRHFVALCPFVSRSAFEVRIFPRRHRPAFEESNDGELADAAEALQVALAKLSRALGRPAYNFFIHTAPAAGGGAAPYYHWHVEIIPKTSTAAGFEISTGIEIATTSPEAAARFLRSIEV